MERPLFFAGCSGGLGLLCGVCLLPASAASGLGLSLKEIRSGWFSGVGAIFFMRFRVASGRLFRPVECCAVDEGAVKGGFVFLKRVFGLGLRFWSVYPQKGDR